MDNPNLENAINKKIALIIAALSAFLTPFMASSINIALPSIGKEFSINAVLLSWIPTSYILAAAMFLVPFGKVADIYGRKKIFTFGIIIYTFSCFLTMIANSVFQLIIFRVLNGIGGAMIFGTGTAILTSIFPIKERGRALGMNVAATYLGLSLGPVLGGFLTQYFGWRSIFFANIPFGLIILVLVLWKLDGEWAEARGEKFDYIGSIIYSLSLISLMYGFSLLPKISGIWLVFIGFLGIIAFIFMEVKIEHPVLNMDLFKNNSVFAFSNLAALINYSATYAVGFLLSLYLQFVKIISPQDAGLILVSQPIIMTIFSPFAGRLSDRIEPGIVASIGMGVTVIGLFLLIFISESTSTIFIIFILVLLGFGFALFSSPNTNAVMSSVEKKFYGVSSATLGTMRLTGQMFSMGIAMMIFTIFIGKVQIKPEYHSPLVTSMKTIFIIFAVLCIFGVFASLARGKVREKEK
jgi:EmrB/QacA subfamily drug resistance transporter